MLINKTYFFPQRRGKNPESHSLVWLSCKRIEADTCAAPSFGAETRASRGQTRREEPSAPIAACRAHTYAEEETVRETTHTQIRQWLHNIRLLGYIILFSCQVSARERARERGVTYYQEGGPTEFQFIPSTTCPPSVGKRRAFLPSKERARIK